MARLGSWIEPFPEGIYVRPADAWIDPSRPKERALVTHGHADHARGGHSAVWATPETLAIMATRYGEQNGNPVAYGESFRVGKVDVRFVPAGHVLGSAQIVLEHAGERIVVSGDYKRREDPTCAPFEPVPCDIFITEATFGLPVFRHPPDTHEIAKLVKSTEQFPERAHLVGAYALGKAQRVIRLIRDCGYSEPIFIHGALAKLCDYYVGQGIDLGDIRPATIEKSSPDAFKGAVIVGPPSAFQDRWARRFNEPLIAFASGWMMVRQRAKQGGVELPLVISDHCDWPELLSTIEEIGPSEVWVTHGREEALVRWCELKNIPARPLHLVGYEDEGD